MPTRLLVSLSCLLVSAASLLAQSSVWQVTRGTNTLYLGGTCHVLRPGDFPLPAEFDQAFDASEVVYFETDISRMQSDEMQRVVATHGMFTDGTTLEKVLSPAAWRAVRTYCENAGLPLAEINRFKPWFFTLMTAALELQKIGVSAEGVDLYYFRKASQAGRRTGALESFDRHIQFLVGLGAGQESDMIEKSLAEVADIPSMFSQLIAAWRAGDVGKIDDLMLRDMREKYPVVFKELLVERNVAWMVKLEQFLETPEVEFVLVGAGHLAGAEGLLALLQARGYAVEQVRVATPEARQPAAPPTAMAAAPGTAPAAGGSVLPRVLFFANPMRSDNDVIRRRAPDELSVAERHFAALTRGVFEVRITQDGTAVSGEKLAGYDAVVFFTAINPPDVDRNALIAWVRSGGAFVGIHSTANTYQNFPAFGEMLGARYDRRPWRTPQNPQTKVRIKVDDPRHPATRHLGDAFEIADDIYQFKDFDRENVHLLLSLDPSSLDLSAPKMNREDRHLPVAWARTFGAGRVFYTALGDWEETWADPRFRLHLLQGILWAMHRQAPERTPPTR
jgi:uncharacterized protein YbaP (TraB family)/type 1 glutamine amidotransferase